MRILLLEDHDDIAQPLLGALRFDRYEVLWAACLEQAFKAVATTTFDLAVVDVMLPGDDDAGFAFAHFLRESGFDGPILFISARDAESDTVRGLDIGGDDYLVKPFGIEEFLARVRALARRSAQTKRALLDRAPLVIDLESRSVRWRGGTIDVSDREFAMLELFALYPDRVFAVSELVERFFPAATSGPGAVRVYVSQLRHKFAPNVIRTVSGGYRLGLAER